MVEEDIHLVGPPASTAAAAALLLAAPPSCLAAPVRRLADWPLCFGLALSLRPPPRSAQSSAQSAGGAGAAWRRRGTQLSGPCDGITGASLAGPGLPVAGACRAHAAASSMPQSTARMSPQQGMTTRSAARIRRDLVNLLSPRTLVTSLVAVPPRRTLDPRAGLGRPRAAHRRRHGHHQGIPHCDARDGAGVPHRADLHDGAHAGDGGRAGAPTAPHNPTAAAPASWGAEGGVGDGALRACLRARARACRPTAPGWKSSKTGRRHTPRWATASTR